MSAPRRAVFVWDGQRLQQEHLDALVSAKCDELVVAIVHAEEGFSSSQPYTGGQRIERLSTFLSDKIAKPLYLLPLKTSQLSPAQLALRLRYDLPAFSHLLTTSADLERAAAQLLPCTSTRIELGNGPDLLAPAKSTSRRGLFITRAQPFHAGHAACVQKIAEEMDEVIVLVALAETSHSLQNPATAGERLEMIHPYLCRTLPGRFHLAAAPYEPHTACNVSELQLLLPKFACIYSNSPGTQALAVSAGVAYSPIRTTVGASGAEVRQALLDGAEIGTLVPPEVAAALDRMKIRKRLQILSSEEVRRVG